MPKYEKDLKEKNTLGMERFAKILCVYEMGVRMFLRRNVGMFHPKSRNIDCLY